MNARRGGVGESAFRCGSLGSSDSRNVESRTTYPRDGNGVPVIHVTSTGLIVRGGRVLLGKRTSKTRFAGMWDAFGGHLVPCEEPAMALVRELQEELGIRAIGPRFVEIYEDVDPTSKDLFRHYLFLVTRWEGEPRIANEEHSEIRWFRPDEVDGIELASSLKGVIHKLLPAKT